ncbi:DDE-type integrase/transposase/recombinase [Streptomyces agglomeratus]|uniref:DDE-type integrase/transposase/recombinase n=1 Tax=Streptomyces agglomeratus TaxID=285458 RepID=UPI00099FF7B4|nr:DDE-type integrase/transposase/recombinase [Streptomyces agglomeratus]
MNSAEYAELPPAQIWARELDAGRYHCSVSTMYRVLREHGQSGERRRQATHPARAVPELVAIAPSQVFTWDITKLAGPAKGIWYHAYVVIDIFSRYIVGHTVERAESAERAEELIRETIDRNGIVPETVHADRGTSMTSKKVSQLLIDLGVTRSHSRPKVSNDNPYSEAQFKTTKYMSDYPNGSIPWRTHASGSRRSRRTATMSTGTRVSAGTHLRVSTSAPPKRSATSAPSPSPRPTPATPNASAAAPHHPKYPGKRGSTTPPNAGNLHHRSHSITNVSLDLKSSGAPINGAPDITDVPVCQRPVLAWAHARAPLRSVRPVRSAPDSLGAAARRPRPCLPLGRRRVVARLPHTAGDGVPADWPVGR